MSAACVHSAARVGEARTCAGLDELSRASGCMLGSIVDAPKRGSADCESGDAFILSFRREVGTCAPAVGARGRFFGGCTRLGFAVPSEESCIKQSTAPSASSSLSLSVDCTCCSIAAAAARLGEPGELGWSVGTASFATETETGSWHAAGGAYGGNWLHSASAADQLSWARTVGGVISSGPSMRTKPVCICQAGAARLREHGVGQSRASVGDRHPALRLRLCRLRWRTAGSVGGRLTRCALTAVR